MKCDFKLYEYESVSPKIHLYEELEIKFKY